MWSLFMLVLTLSRPRVTWTVTGGPEELIVCTRCTAAPYCWLAVAVLLAHGSKRVYLEVTANMNHITTVPLTYKVESFFTLLYYGISYQLYMVPASRTPITCHFVVLYIPVKQQWLTTCQSVTWYLTIIHFYCVEQICSSVHISLCLQ